MEAFEHIAKVSLEAEDFVVTSNLKFPVRRRTGKKAREEYQEHGYEVDLVGAKRDALVLASVKSFLGSRGVAKTGFRGLDDSKPSQQKGYLMFNEPEIRAGIIEQAARRFGYDQSQVQLRLYVGKFASDHESEIRRHLSAMSPPVAVFGLDQMIELVDREASSKTYRNDAVVVTVKVLRQLGWTHGREHGDRP